MFVSDMLTVELVLNVLIKSLKLIQLQCKDDLAESNAELELVN